MKWGCTELEGDDVTPFQTVSHKKHLALTSQVWHEFNAPSRKSAFDSHECHIYAWLPPQEEMPDQRERDGWSSGHSNSACPEIAFVKSTTK